MSRCRAPLWGPRRDFSFSFLCSENCFASLWREDESVICSTICHWVSSNHTLLSHLRPLGSLSVASYDSQGLRWKFSYPPPHGHYLNKLHKPFASFATIIYIYIHKIWVRKIVRIRTQLKILVCAAYRTAHVERENGTSLANTPAQNCRRWLSWKAITWRFIANAFLRNKLWEESEGKVVLRNPVIFCERVITRGYTETSADGWLSPLWELQIPRLIIAVHNVTNNFRFKWHLLHVTACSWAVARSAHVERNCDLTLALHEQPDAIFSLRAFIKGIQWARLRFSTRPGRSTPGAASQMSASFMRDVCCLKGTRNALQVRRITAKQH
jgi:hypothetical protein